MLHKLQYPSVMALLHVGITAEDLRDEKVLNVHVDLPSCLKGQNPKHTSAFLFTSSRLQLKKTKKQHFRCSSVIFKLTS